MQYTQTHFAREEQILVQAGCPATMEHMKAHDELARQVIDLRRRYRNGAHATLSLDVLRFLKAWLTEHIQNEDKKYQPCLQARGLH